MFLHEPMYEQCVHYLTGNPMEHKDLTRADTNLAKRCILLTNKNSKDAYAIDHKNILTGLSMKKFA